VDELHVWSGEKSGGGPLGVDPVDDLGVDDGVVPAIGTKVLPARRRQRRNGDPPSRSTIGIIGLPR